MLVAESKDKRYRIYQYSYNVFAIEDTECQAKSTIDYSLAVKTINGISVPFNQLKEIN